jgi:hypothetical protein
MTALHLAKASMNQGTQGIYRGSSKNRAPPSAFVTGAKILHHEKQRGLQQQLPSSRLSKRYKKPKSFC